MRPVRAHLDTCLLWAQMFLERQGWYAEKLHVTLHLTARWFFPLCPLVSVPNVLFRDLCASFSKYILRLFDWSTNVCVNHFTRVFV